MKKFLIVFLILMMYALPAYALQNGDTGEGVLSLQNRLIALGYLDGIANGRYGERTSAAVARLRVFAQTQGITLDGAEDEATETLLAALAGDEIPAYIGEPKPGDTSEAVMRLQRRLRTLGYLSDRADGFFGDNTLRALTVFQWFSGLPRTGYADAQTQDSLFSKSAKAAPHPVLHKGSKGDKVMALQKRLTLLGFFDGDIDAQYGEETVSGVKAFETYIQKSGHYDALEPALRGASAEGIADPLIQSLLYTKDFPLIAGEMREGDEGQEVYRLQRRLSALLYLNQTADGGYGEKTAKAVAAFQKQNGLKQTGIANEKTQRLLYSEEAAEKIRPYKLEIRLSEQKIYVYARDKKGEYTKLSYNFPCSTGKIETPTPIGSYQAYVRPLSKWRKGSDGLIYQYALQLQPGLQIHGLPYDQKNGNADISALSTIGSAVTDGNILVSDENAHLIYTKCPRKTPVEIVP